MTKYELHRVGKRHIYSVMLQGRFVGEIRRAMIGVWVGAMSGGVALEATFKTRDEALAVMVARHAAER